MALLGEDRVSVAEPISPGEEAAPRRALFPGMRTRILLSFLVLLALSTAASLFVLREVLLSRIGDQVTTSLTEDVEDLQTLVAQQAQAGGDGRQASLEQVFSTYLKRHGLNDDSAVVTF